MPPLGPFLSLSLDQAFCHEGKLILDQTILTSFQ